jgi:hypothetical protein
MSTSELSSGDISKEELSELAYYFDLSEFAFDPLSSAAKEGKAQFEDKVRNLFHQKVEKKYPSIDFSTFRQKVRTECRAYLRGNKPQDLPPNQNPLP